MCYRSSQQAEHGPTSPAILLTDSEKLAIETIKEVDETVTNSSNCRNCQNFMERIWTSYSLYNIEEMVEVADKLAFEHVQVMTEDPDYFHNNMTNYGALFLRVKNKCCFWR